MASNLAWNEHDEEKPWESDKFTVFDELAYQSGIDTAPDKGPDIDKEYAKIYEKKQYLQSNEGKIEAIRSLAAHMLEDDIRSGTIDQSEYYANKAGGYTHRQHKSNAVENTQGSFLNSLDVVDGSDDNDSVFGSDDDLFNDDDDDELNRKLQQIRSERLKELQLAKQSGRDPNSSNTATAAAGRTSETALLSQALGPGVHAISAEQFENDVKRASKTNTVFMLIHNPKDRASQLMITIINSLAQRLPQYKYTVVTHSAALSHVPLAHCPILMCYHNEQVVGSFARLDAFHGSRTTALDVEWTLAKCGIIDSNLTEDPKESALFD